MKRLLSSEKRKFNLINQAIFASGALLCPAISIADETIINAPGGLNNNGDWVYFTGAGPLTVVNGDDIGISDGTKNTPTGLSVATSVNNQGQIIFSGESIVAGGIGQHGLIVNDITEQSTGAVKLVELNGPVYTNTITFDGVNQPGTIYLSHNAFVTGNIIFVDARPHFLQFLSDERDLLITVSDIVDNGNRASLAFSGKNRITFTGTIGVGGSLNNISITENSIVDISNNISSNTIRILNSAILNVNANLTMTGAFHTDAGGGTLNLNSNQLTINGLLNPLNQNDTLAIQTSDAIHRAFVANKAVGHMHVTGNATNDAKSQLAITPIGYIGSSTAATGITVIHSNGGAGVLNDLPATQISGQSAVLTITAVNNAAANTDLNLVVTRTPYTSVIHDLASDAIGMGAALELDGAAGALAATNPTLELAVGAIDRLQTSAEVNDAIAQLGPTANLAIGQNAQLFIKKIIGTINQRLQIVRWGDLSYNTGMSAGDINDDWGVWGQLFGTDFTQKKRHRVQGYAGSSTGLTFGVDQRLSNDTVLGLAASYSTSGITYDLAASTLDIDSIQASIYGSYQGLDQPWYIQGILGVVHHHYDQHRHININNALSGTALSDFNAWEGLANLEVGYVYNKGAWHFAPSAGLKYSYLDIHQYTERGAEGYNLTVAHNNIDELGASLGLLVQHNSVYRDTTLVPEVHIAAFYDFIADRQISESHLWGTATVFNTKSYVPAKMSFEVGLGLNIHTNKDIIFSVNYDYNFKSDFYAHSGFVKLRYAWG